MPFTITRTFEGGLVGARPIGPEAFDFSGTGPPAMVYDDQHTASGTRSAKFTYANGDEEIGATIEWGLAPAQGAEVWCRAYVRLGSPWSWACSDLRGQTMKLIRPVRVKTATGGHIGYLSLFGALVPRGNGGALEYSNEVADHQPTILAQIPLDTWMCLEVYHLLHATPGQAKARVWMDGALLYENLVDETLRSATDQVGGGGRGGDGTLVLSQWNGRCPQAQSIWFDDIVITDQTPAARDAAGHPMIGPMRESSCTPR